MAIPSQSTKFNFSFASSLLSQLLSLKICGSDTFKSLHLSKCTYQVTLMKPVMISRINCGICMNFRTVPNVNYFFCQEYTIRCLSKISNIVPTNHSLRTQLISLYHMKKKASEVRCGSCNVDVRNEECSLRPKKY